MNEYEGLSRKAFMNAVFKKIEDTIEDEGMHHSEKQVRIDGYKWLIANLNYKY